MKPRVGCGVAVQSCHSLYGPQLCLGLYMCLTQLSGMLGTQGTVLLVGRASEAAQERET